MPEEKRINFEVSVGELMDLINQKDKNITAVMIQLIPGKPIALTLAGIQGKEIDLHQAMVHLRPIS